MARKSLEEILSDENTDLEESIASENTKLAVAEPEEEKGEEPEPVEEPEAEPPSAETSEESGLLAAKQAEKARRKAAEEEARQFREQLESLRQEIKQQSQPKESEQPAPSLWEDDQAWQQHFGGQIVNQATAAAAYQNKLNTSEFYARKNIDGFDAEWDGLNKWLQENPAIAQQASADYDPWGYAYRAYSNKKTMDELGATDITSLKEQLRQEILAEAAAQNPTQPVIPKSLTNKRSVASRSGPAWAGPKSLDELLS